MKNGDMRVNGMLNKTAVAKELNSIYKASLDIESRDRFNFIVISLLCRKFGITLGEDECVDLYKNERTIKLRLINSFCEKINNSDDSDGGFIKGILYNRGILDYFDEILNNRVFFTGDKLLSEFCFQNSILRFLDSVNPLDEEYTQLFDIAYELSTAEYETSNVSDEIVNLASHMVRKEKIHTVYDPYARLMKFADIFPKSILFEGKEISETTWRYGQIRLALSGRGDVSFVNKKLMDWNETKYDLIISFPQVKAEEWTGTNRPGPSEYVMLDRFEHYTNADGQMFMLSTPYILDTKQSKFVQLRKDLISKHYIDTIVLLPAKLIKGMNSYIVALYLNKNKRDGNVRMIDARKMFVKEGQTIILDSIKLIETLNNKDNEDSLVVSEAEFIENGYFFDFDNIYASRNIRENALHPIVKLGHVIESTKKFPNQERGRRNAIQIKNLSVDPFVEEVDSEEFEIENPSDYYYIFEPSLLVASAGSMKTGFVYADEANPICIHRNVLAFSFLNDVDKDYVRYAISKLTYLFTGSVIPHLSLASLLKADIELPESLDVQRSIYVEAKRTFLLEKAKTNGLSELIEEKKNEYMNEVRMRKHDMRPYIRNMRSNYNMMMQYVKDHRTMPDFEEKMQERLSRLLDNINNLSEMLENLSNDESFGTPENIDIKEYLETIVKRYGTEDRFKITSSIDDTSLEIIDDENEIEDIFNVNIARIDLQRMVDNIIGNAIKHGFSDPKKQYNIHIVLGVDPETKMIFIDFSNDGNPMPNGMDKVAYGRLGEKFGANAGSGQGGHIVKRIVEHYNGDYDVLCDEVQTTIRILLPMSQLI